ncbi:MAG: diguanylate cyclase (GGDEF)-like protein/PAS domain S-box-containing protein [Gammaproteobacteria bacterium]|jgi:diguanylate cyclase (GGDEF)-like protein/PAS domain S-box-containing protein
MGNTYGVYSESLLRIVKGKALHSGDPVQSFEEITEAASNTLKVERVGIWIHADDHRSTRCVNLYNLATDSHSSAVDLYEEDFPNYFAALNEDRVIDACDAYRDPRTCEFSETYLPLYGISSMLDAPIRFAGRTIGIICIEHVGEQRQWTSDEITFAASLADLITHALEAQKLKSAEIALIESEDRYRRAAFLTRTGHQIWDEVADKSIYCSIELAELYGVSVEEYMRRSSSIEKDLEWYHPDDRERYDDVARTAFKNKTGYDIVARIIRADGEVRYIHEITDVKLDVDGKVLQTIGAIQDITERKLIEEELRTQSQIITNMIEGALLIRLSDGIIVYANPSAEKMFGYAPDQLTGKCSALLQGSGDLALTEPNLDILRHLGKSDQWHGEILNVKQDASEFWCSVNISMLEHPVHGRVGVFVGSDVTERRLAIEKLGYQARHDGLTGLINRNEFESRLNQLIEKTRRQPGEHALCYMDLDQFKVVNDSCGHTAGDELLRQLGQVLHEAVRQCDTLARLGGDEFGIIMEDCSLSQAQWAVAALQTTIQDFQFRWEGQSFRIGVSIGLVAINESTPSLTELMKHADAACYMAKDLGRNRIHVYHPEDAEIAQRHGEMQWISRINQALVDNRFVLFAQEILRLDSDPGQHYEVLLRMIDEQGNLVPPGAFLPAAERYEIIDKLDVWVIENTLARMAAHNEKFGWLPLISINLSGPSLTKPGFLELVISQINKYSISPDRLCFEVTETAAISNLKSATRFIEQLKARGCCFALDDFGSGLSSFGYLKNLPVDYLKIDGMFVKDMVDDPIDCSMVKSINDIGQVMGMETIAEFVENDEIKQMLIEIGVDCVQGYGIGKPQDFVDLLDQLSKPRASQILVAV